VTSLVERGLLLLALVLVLAAAVACEEEGEKGTARPTASPAVAEFVFPLTVTDSEGRQVTLPEPPRRIITLAASHTETVFAIGAGSRVIAVDKYSSYPPEVEGLEKLGHMAEELSLEKLVELQPDLVVLSHAQVALLPQMEDLGLRVLVLEEPSTLEGVLGHVETLGKATGHSQEARALAASMRQRIEQVEDKLAAVEQGPRVFYELDPMLFTAGPGSFIDDLLGILKAQNVAQGGDSPYPQLTLEALVAADPEVILLADSGEFGGQSAETVKARPGWGGISAVKNDRIYEVDPYLLDVPGPRLVDGLEALGRLLYPDLFP